MIRWSELLIAIPLALPEIIAAAAAAGLMIRRRSAGRLLPWLVTPVALLGFSAAMRFVPIFVLPVERWVNDVFGLDSGLAVLWSGDMFLRIAAWAALLYALFWKLPARNDPAPLDPKTKQTAATAALLAILLTDAKDETAPPASGP